MADPLRHLVGRSLAEFAATHWDRAPLLVRRAERTGAPDDVFTLAAVDELVAARGLRTPFVRMTRDGVLVPPARYTRSGGAGAEIADQVEGDRILAEFAAGATLVVQGLHRVWEPVREFAVALVDELGHPVQINAYVTPPENTGFAPHYDVHDVFVVQFAGRKHWRVHEPVWNLPLRDQPSSARAAAVVERAAQTPTIDAVLDPGDVLYLPRGYVHAATSLGDVSGHLTIGVHPVTRHLLVERLFAALADDEDLRRALPLGAALTDDAALRAELAATIDVVREALTRVDPAIATAAVARHLDTTTRPGALRPLEQLAAAAALGPETRVRLRPGLRLTFRDEPHGFVVVLPDRSVVVDAAAAGATRTATAGPPVSARDLPGLDADAGVALLGRLLRDGVVVPA